MYHEGQRSRQEEASQDVAAPIGSEVSTDLNPLGDKAEAGSGHDQEAEGHDLASYGEATSEVTMIELSTQLWELRKDPVVATVSI